MADIPRNKQASWFQKSNHLALKKSEVTKPLILDAGVSRLSGLGKTIETIGGTPATLNSGFRNEQVGSQTIPLQTDTPLTAMDLEFFTSSVAMVDDVFTVPASWDGFWGVFVGNFRTGANIASRCTAIIELSTDGGTNWIVVGVTTDQNVRTPTCHSGLRLLNEGDKYRLTGYSNDAATTLADYCSLSGVVVNG